MARILLAVAGGIAAYKAPELARNLVRRGHEVRVILTPSARSFVTELSLATVSGHPVRWDVLDLAGEGEVGHIELADWPDLVVVAPATANLLARAAAGLANDLVTTVLLATRASVLWAPAMNTNMWTHPATRANLATLADRGAAFVGPDRGALACGWVGEGRMMDPVVISEAAEDTMAGQASSWEGRRVLVSAGPTRAYLDPVRFLTNASTGAMGFALARVAARRGATVTLVAGPVDRATPPGVTRVDVETGEDMRDALDAELRAGPCDLVAMVAAVADLVPAERSPGKLPKDGLLEAVAGARWARAPDVLAGLCRAHGGRSYFLGFAAETLDDSDTDDQLLVRGRVKRADKGCQALFVNRVGVPETGFATDTNAGLLLIEGDVHPSGPPVPKPVLAGWLLDRLQGVAWVGGKG